jgi:hypothetical protein
MRSLVLLSVLFALGAVAWVAAVGADIGSQADADALRQKLLQIATNGLAATPQSRQTSVSEQEVNAYIRAFGQEGLPQGVIDPSVTILPDGRLSGRAVLDLDTLGSPREGDAATPWSILRGQVPVEATGTLRTQRGVGAFTIESATVGGVAVPKAMLQQLISYYSRSAEQPQGVNIEAPFRLPAKIREIRTTRGQALIVQ